MKNFDAIYTNASCYESLMWFPAEVALEVSRENILDDVRNQYSARCA